MQVSTIQLPPLPPPNPDDGPTLVEFGLDWDSVCLMWRMLLALAVREGAESMHYHPWRADGRLSYIVAGVRHVLNPPPPKLAGRVAAAAGALACGNWAGAVSRRLLGWPVRASGRVRFAGEHGPSEWAGVVWADRQVVGVEWYRLDRA
jgi:hypothetical protein